jgi:2-succinyl-6-hydroxy-2,4-cyclohexadiene-1-carboxylate synthase
MLINGINYHVEAHGSGDPLVLLHGFTGSGASWAAQIQALQTNFRVVAIDLLGHGQTTSPSDSARYAIESASRDLIAVLDVLGVERANLLCYSMGGRLALYTALTYPQRIGRLVLESASPGLRTDAERRVRIASDRALADRIERDGMAAFADDWSSIPLFATQSPELRQRLHDQRLSNNPTGLANSLRGMGTGVQPPLWDRLGELVLPTLLIAGEHDAKFRAINGEIQRLIPGARLEIVAGAGHTVHAEQPLRYNEIVRTFLKG